MLEWFLLALTWFDNQSLKRNFLTMNALTKTIASTVFLVAASSTATANDAPLGCYKPVRGFAASICTDTELCTTQAGIFRIVLRNRDAPIGERRLIISGTFRGAITGTSDLCEGGVMLSHLLMDKDMEGSLKTEGDVACPIGGDGIDTLEVIETLKIADGFGIYEGVLPGSQVTLTGTLGLSTGINTFRLKPTYEDEVCFD
jgi:hypothetical protein